MGTVLHLEGEAYMVKFDFLGGDYTEVLENEIEFSEGSRLRYV